MSTEWGLWTEGALDRLASQQLLRAHRPLHIRNSSVKAYVTKETFDAWVSNVVENPERLPEQGDGSLKELTLFSSNDYLGLSCHPDIKLAAAKCVAEYGMGPRSSPLVCGFTPHHRELEVELADLKGTEESILFPTGFAANIGAISALASGPDVAIFSDALNHASIVDGCRLAAKSGASLQVFRHSDMDDLNQMLRNSSHRRKMVVTDTIFSMDGDYAKLKELVALKKRYTFSLVVDEAHATLVCGVNGGGACEKEQVSDEVDVHVGTLSKAAGTFGGFVCCKAKTRQLLTSQGRSHVFSTSLPVPIVCSALEAVRVSRREWWRRKHLSHLMDVIGEELGIAPQTPIIPLIVGSESSALTFGKTLLQNGFHVGTIRPPTVPKGTSRLRISLSAAHSINDVLGLTSAVKKSGHAFSSTQTPSKPKSRL